MNTSRDEAERWLAWLDGDRKDDGTRPMVGTPYQAAQRIAKRLHEGERDRIRAIQELGAMARGEVPDEDDGWRDYDHGFRDGYQAGRREGPDALLQAARWVVRTLDREVTQHASLRNDDPALDALRQAVQSVGDYQAAVYGSGGLIGVEEARRMSDNIDANEGLAGPQPIRPSPMVGELTGKTARERDHDRAQRWWWMTR